jgi:hypothetical protein
MRFSKDSSVVGGVARGVALASSGGRLRHDENSPVRSMWGPGNSTDAPTRARSAVSWAYSDSLSVTTADLVRA